MTPEPPLSDMGVTPVRGEIKIGDKVTIPVPVYRKWWQLWKPRIVGQRDQEFVVTKQTVTDGFRDYWRTTIFDQRHVMYSDIQTPIDWPT